MQCKLFCSVSLFGISNCWFYSVITKSEKEGSQFYFWMTLKNCKPPPFPQLSSSSNLTKLASTGPENARYWSGTSVCSLLSVRFATSRSSQGPSKLTDPSRRNFLVERSRWIALWVFLRITPPMVLLHPRYMMKPCPKSPSSPGCSASKSVRYICKIWYKILDQWISRKVTEPRFLPVF